MDAGEKLLTHAVPLAALALYWTLARLCISVFALLLGTPPALYLFSFGSLYTLVGLLVKISWVVSGVAAAYLLYRWYDAKWYVFEKATGKDIAALAIAIISGLNLGATGLLGTNIGMSTFSAYIFWLAGAAIYAWTARHLYRRFVENGNKIFL